MFSKILLYYLVSVAWAVLKLQILTSTLVISNCLIKQRIMHFNGYEVLFSSYDLLEWLVKGSWQASPASQAVAALDVLEFLCKAFLKELLLSERLWPSYTVYTAARMVHLQECTRTWHRIVTLCKVCHKCLCLHRGRAEHTLDLNMLLQIESHWLSCVFFHLSSHKNLWSSTQQKLSLWLTPHPTPKQGSKRCRSPQAALQLLYFTFELIYFEKKGS